MYKKQKSVKLNKQLSYLVVLACFIATLTSCSKGDIKANSSSKSTTTASADSKGGQTSSSKGKSSKSDNASSSQSSKASNSSNTSSKGSLSTNDLPKFNGKPYVEINQNVPSFTKDDLTTSSWEKYSDLDSLKRVGVANANIGKDLMPTAKRGEIGMIKPTGWHTVKYDGVDGKYLYNRCHLVGFQLAGENANDKNLMTGTRYMNVDGMLPFENEVADYVKRTGNHVRYRVTPIFVGNELVARGVQMEGQSVEDKGSSVKFNVYVFNAQPTITINYASGDSSQDGKKS